LTIELRGETPPHLREATGEHLFGCDDCQTACPFNASERSRDGRGLEAFEPGDAMRTTSLVGLLSGGTEGWDAFSKGSPLKRATLEGLARNAAVVLGNRREATALPDLVTAAEHHPSPVVREAASWAARQYDA
jgi:epoxyqueuosine reductase